MKKGFFLKLQIKNGALEGSDETIKKTDYRTYPVVMMVEGIHSGSDGPVFFDHRVLLESIKMWDGIPATIGHPDDGYNYVDLIQDENTVGFISDTVFKSTINGLGAKLWVDKDGNEELIEKIEDGSKIDVSVGVWYQTYYWEGEWNGEKYSKSAHDLVGDHLALLPDSIGACSWQDGCGIRDFKKHKVDNKKQDKGSSKMKDKAKNGAAAQTQDDPVKQQTAANTDCSQAKTQPEPASAPSYDEWVASAPPEFRVKLEKQKADLERVRSEHIDGIEEQVPGIMCKKFMESVPLENLVQISMLASMASGDQKIVDDDDDDVDDDHKPTSYAYGVGNSSGANNETNDNNEMPTIDYGGQK